MPTRTLVIGGAGFLGSALATAIHQRGDSVTVFDRVPHPNPAIPTHVGDLTHRPDLDAACASAEVVFHTASFVAWNPRQNAQVYAVNVTGAENVLAACQQHGVKKLIYTSSIDAVFDGSPIRDGDESLPYPTHFLNEYSRTKALAEQRLLAAHGQHGLAICALRTAGIYGPGDRHRLPSVIAAIDAGQYARMGDGRAVFNHVYIDNVIHAHLLAADALNLTTPPGGRAYFVTDHPAQNFYTFIETLLTRAGYTVPNRRLPVAVAYPLAVLAETATTLLPINSPFTRYTVRSTCRDFSFTHARATADFGYQPIVALDDAIARTAAAFRRAS